MQKLTHSPEETEAFAAMYANTLRLGDTVALCGRLGAGKTAFARGILRGLGYTGRVTSPTFVLANEYDTPRGRVTHFDLYRIQNIETLFDIGFDEYFDGNRVVLVEWSENAAGMLPPHYKTVCLTAGDAEQDRLIITGEAAQ